MDRPFLHHPVTVVFPADIIRKAEAANYRLSVALALCLREAAK